MLKICLDTSRFKPRLSLPKTPPATPRFKPRPSFKIKSPCDLIMVVKMPVPTADKNLTTDKLYYDITDFKQYNL